MSMVVKSYEELYASLSDQQKQLIKAIYESGRGKGPVTRSTLESATQKIYVEQSYIGILKSDLEKLNKEGLVMMPPNRVFRTLFGKKIYELMVKKK